MKNVLIGLDKSGSYRVYLTVSTEVAEMARQVHGTTPLGTAALGRVLTGTGLMGLMLKNDQDKVTVQFKGDGPAREILAAADGSGRVKGYISNPDVDLPRRPDGKMDVGGALGIGTITVIKDLGLKEPYVGRIDLVSGEIAEDLTAYFFISEQQSSSVALGVKVDGDGSVGAAGGLIIQMLPGRKPEAIDALEAMLDKLTPISTLIENAQKTRGVKSDEALLDDLLATVFADMPEEFQPAPIGYREMSWYCGCSMERMEKALISVGEKDLKSIYEEDGQAELTCQFCLSRYQFDGPHLATLLDEAMGRC